MKKRFIALLLCMCIVVSLFSGCGVSGSNRYETKPGETWNGEQIQLYPNGKIAFRIIRAEKASNEIIGYAAKIKEEIKERLDITAEYKPDTVVEKEGLYEVCVGETNRAGYKEVYDDLVNYQEKHGNDWTIQMVGNKIFIVGGSNVAIEQAVDYFIEMFCSTLGTIITTEYAYTYKYDVKDSFSICGDVDLKGYKIVMPQYNMSYIVGRELEPLSAALARYNMADVKIVSDTEKESDKEIVVGVTNRGSVANLSDRDDWQITVKDKKVFIEGGHNYSNAIAVLEFIKYIKDGKAFKDGDVIKGKYSETIKDKAYDDYYRITASDEFDGDTVDDKFFEVLDQKDRDGDTTYHGKEAWRRKDNVTVKDGKMYGKGTYDANSYNGFMLSAQDRFWYKYGLIEISAILPSGEGFWSGFWTVGPGGASSNIEFDIFEQFSIGERLKQSCLDWPAPDGKRAYCGVDKNKMEGQPQFSYYCLPEGENFSDTYHTIGLEWDENWYRMLVDGRVLYEVEYGTNEYIAKTIRQYAYPMISLAVGFIGSDVIFNMENGEQISLIKEPVQGADYWTTSNEYIAEYFQLYQKPGQEIKFRN